MGPGRVSSCFLEVGLRAKSVCMYIEGPLGHTFGKEGNRLCFLAQGKRRTRVHWQIDDQEPGPSGSPADSRRALFKGTQGSQSSTYFQQLRWKKPASLSLCPHPRINRPLSRSRLLRRGWMGAGMPRRPETHFGPLYFYISVITNLA